MTKRNLLSRIAFDKNGHDMVAKYMTRYFGSIWFLYALLTFVLGWALYNSSWIGGVFTFDPYPFVLLIMIVQLFEVFLSVIVLINQNRQEKMSDVRQQVEFEVNVRAETEITKILQMVQELHTRLGIAKFDRELEQMKEPTNITEIKERIEFIIEEEKNSIIVE